ncbi:MAG: DnaA regulatory inactivator Hda [Gammaproteobacteria bacterium]|jgi:DnaA family protein|nr:DnaA regulatory inactivator Hda [Gammaproteobacteria bacterium]MBT3488627.1 DnaA regulatory inactivator Hda [Gammaproteobacteria bacterium]MBT3718268.1 DnaA regulatory inactivator Hda [Gammaproteobacteria bacterium]MBT3846128.1 DnaA regulatory inactivator Hda [Gammaproteobacteria bacterium]MBT3893156.1 DnaA regulatory inactivator Hda [Gammaproteobacteria bacterium]
MDVQIPLLIPYPDNRQASFENFVGFLDHPVVTQLQKIATGTAPHLFYLWGVEGVGKSHLVHATCNLCDQQGGEAVLFPLDQLVETATGAESLLSSVEEKELVVLENLNHAVGRAVWEEMLFHLLNQLRDAGTHLIITARLPLSELGIQLADLRSRLSEGVVGHLQPLDDMQKWQVVQQRAQQRGMEMGDEVVNFLMQRTARDFHTLFALLDRLDRETLIAQRKITIPFVKQLFDL